MILSEIMDVLILQSETLQTTFGRRAILLHLMASMASRFDRVLMTHFTKGVCRRTIIHR